MITSLRSVLICERVEQDADGNLTLHGVAGEMLTADTRPGLVNVWLTIALEVDGSATPGQVKIDAPNFGQAIPFSVPAHVGLTYLAFPIAVPVFGDGTLDITVVDDARKSSPFTVKWKIGLDDDAEVLGHIASEALVDAAKTHAEQVRKHFTPERSH